MPLSCSNFSMVEVSGRLIGSRYPIQLEKTSDFSLSLRSSLTHLSASTLAPSVPQAVSQPVEDRASAEIPAPLTRDLRLKPAVPPYGWMRRLVMPTPPAVAWFSDPAPARRTGSCHAHPGQTSGSAWW